MRGSVGGWVAGPAVVVESRIDEVNKMHDSRCVFVLCHVLMM